MPPRHHSSSQTVPSHPTATSQASVREDLPRDLTFPARVMLLDIPSHGERINGVCFRAAGPGPHPVLVLLHGFPGVEQNFDLAHAARRAGWHVLIPRYRGAWASPGTYSWAHVLEDVAATVAWLRSGAASLGLDIDPGKIAIAGHSLGGFAALMTASRDPTIAGVASFAGFNFGAYAAEHAHAHDAVEETASAWSGEVAFLSGTSARALAEETFTHGPEWDLRERAREIIGSGGARPLLIVGATYDEVAPVTLHHEPLVNALRSHRPRSLVARTLATDHSFVDTRLALGDLLVEWLDTVLRV